MPEFVHVFQTGRMNKDLDERLIPNGEYRDALNLDLANSERSNVGVLQNVKGNIELRSKQNDVLWQANYIEDLANPVCIGSTVDEANEKIYWFIASDNVSAIAEYDQTTGFIHPVLVDTQGVLNFTKDYLITGINILDKFLFWTDDQTEPKKINIEKFKTGSTNFLTHTVVPSYDPISNSYSNIISGRPNFLEEDVTVVKKSPLGPIIPLMEPSLVGGFGTGITPVTTQLTTPSGMLNFTYIEDTVNDPLLSIPLDTYGAYLANIADNSNYYQNSSIPNWNGTVTFETSFPPNWQEGSLVLLKSDFVDSFFENYDWEITILVDSVVNNVIVGKIQAISSDIQRFDDDTGNPQIYNWECLLVEEAPMFEYVFPRFAYRWKYIDNEYSCFSPFSEVAFIGSKFEYISTDGYNIGMTNLTRQLTLSGITWGSDEVVEVDILYKEDGKNVVYTVETLKKEEYTTLPTTFEVKTELIGAAIESNQILRPWDNVPLKAKAQEVIGNRIVYGNYLQNRDVPVTKINLAYRNDNHQAVLFPEKMKLPNKSVKSIRTYQAGIVYIDEYGRETPVFSSKESGVKVDIRDSDKANKLIVSPLNTPPGWATHYKFFIKENSNEYYNLALDRFYLAEDGNIWLSFPSSERNKVDEETYLILKKQHDNDISVKELHRYKILSIKNSAPEYISTFDQIVQSSVCTISVVPDALSLLVVFEGPNITQNSDFGKALNGGKIRFTFGGSLSDVYTVERSRVGTDNVTYSVILKKPLGPDASFLTTLSVGNNIGVDIFATEKKDLPEFEGRFFVKINRNYAFDENIIKSFSDFEFQYGILAESNPFKGRINQPQFGGFIFGIPIGDQGEYPDRVICYSDNGCDQSDNSCGSSYASRAKLNGWNLGVGSDMIGSNSHFANWQPPTRNSNKFGIQVLRNISTGTWIDLNFGTVLSTSNSTRTGGTPSNPNGYISTGATIRFQAQKTLAGVVEAGTYTRAYNIRFSTAMYRKRGKRIKPGTNPCKSSSEPWNKGYAIYIELDDPIMEDWMPDANDWGRLEAVLPSLQVVQPITSENNETLTSTNPAIFETEPKEKVDLDLYYEASESKPISGFNTPEQELNWFNCFSFGQGVESNRIRDDFNAPFISKGAKVSTVLDEPYAAERRGSGFIFSQIFNSTSGINRLNQFIQAEPITKDLNPIHGTIQKLYARDTDLITLCEDKCFRVLANKDALFNADGNSQLTGNRAVLGQTVPYSGDYGISKNPESFASFAFRSYFTDKNRGTVIRLSRDGITDIGSKGMSDFYADNLKTSKTIIGLYDDDKGLYHLSLDKLSNQWKNTFSSSQEYQLNPDCNVDTNKPVLQTTVSFKEEVDGWTSRKSFVPESGVSLNNIFYTFKDGRIYEHSLSATANNFYRIQYDSSFNVVVNEMPQVVKGFSTINYTGTRSRLLQYQKDQNFYSIAELNANQIIPTSVQEKRAGWYVNFVKTDLEGGEIKEFQKKEGKYFNFIKGLEVFNDCETSFEGIGNPIVEEHTPQDYILTFTVDLTCSESGSVTPDTIQYFVNIWDNPKQSSIYDLNIEPLTTAQEVKCAIESLYNVYSQNYTSILNSGTMFSYVASDGLQVGTQMYNHLTNEPIAQAGAYLFINTPVDQSSDIVNHAGLDANNSTAVPSSYYVMILGSDGKIASYTQYNTLNACAGDPTKVAHFFSNYSSSKFPFETPNVAVITPYNTSIGGTSTNAQIICAHKNAFSEYFASALPGCTAGGAQPCKTASGIGSFGYYYSAAQGGSDTIAVGTQLYTYNQTLGQYAPRTAYVGVIDISNYNNSFNSPGRVGTEFTPQSFWNNVASLDDKYKIIRINSSGIITHLDQINQITNPTCP